MKGAPAIYMGKIVQKEHFRTFIYSPEGTQRLVESWDEYTQCMETGVWFATKQEALDAIKKAEPEKPKRTRKAKQEAVVEDSPEETIEETMKQIAQEAEEKPQVIEDDFLPKD